MSDAEAAISTSDSFTRFSNRHSTAEDPLVRVSTEPVEDVFERNWVPLVKLASLLMGSRAEGEDVAQDAFARWFVRRSSVDLPDAYLRTCVLNLSRGRLRKRIVVRKHQHKFEVAENALLDPDPLYDVIIRLPIKQRAVVVLRYFEGRTDAEIASLLSCRPGTVRSLLSRALATLRTEVTK